MTINSIGDTARRSYNQPQNIDVDNYVKIGSSIKGESFNCVYGLKPNIAKYAKKKNVRVFIREITGLEQGGAIRMILSNLTKDGLDATPLHFLGKKFKFDSSEKSIPRQIYEFVIESVNELNINNLAKKIKTIK